LGKALLGKTLLGKTLLGKAGRTAFRTRRDHDLNRQEDRRIHSTLRRSGRVACITQPFEDHVGIQRIPPRHLCNRHIRGRRLQADRRSALRSDQWRLRLTSSSVQSRFVRRATQNPIVLTIQSGHYPTHSISGRAVTLDVCGRPHGCKRFFGTIGHVIRCGRVSGLEVAAFQAPRTCMEICRSGPVRLPALDGASSGIMVLPIRSLDRLPLRSSVLLTSAATYRRS